MFASLPDNNIPALNKRLLNFRFSSSTVQFSISLLLAFFAWFFILPSNVCSYVYVFAEEFHLPDAQLILYSNIAGLVGLLIGSLFILVIKNMKKLLLSVSCELLLFNILLFGASPKLGLFVLILQYLLLGIFVTVATYFFLINTMHRKRYYFTGVILASIVFFTTLFSPASDGVTINSVYCMNFFISLVVLVLVIILNALRTQDQSVVATPREHKSVAGAFILMFVYTIAISVAIGYLSNEREFMPVYSNRVSSLLNTLPYIGTLILVFNIEMRKLHLGIITYIANALLIVSIAFVDYFDARSAMSGIVNTMLYFAIAINQLFIFDSTFELAEESRFPSFIIGFGLFAFVSGSATGDHVKELLVVDHFKNVDRVLLTLIALASSILPMLRIMLSKSSKSSIFRINPLTSDSAIPVVQPVQVVEIEVPKPESHGVSPDINHYDSLTNREKEVLDLLIKGYPSELIASTLFISNNTLKRHIQNIYNKLNVHNRAELFKLLHKT